MRRSLVVPVLLAALGACYHGPSARTFAPAQWPDGIEADLRLKGARVRGELLEVQDSALLVLRDSQIVLVPIRAIRTGDFHQRGVLIDHGRISEPELHRLRLVSRFPSGLTPELRARLLATYGQTEADGVTPP
jgi:hypothetical protein